MRVLIPTIRDPGQIGGTTTHISMLVRGLRETGHDVKALYLGAQVPEFVRNAGVVWPAGVLNRIRAGWGMMYAAELRGRLLAAITEKEMAKAGKPWEVLNAQEVYSVPYLRPVADAFGVPLVLTLHGYPLFESISEGYSASSEMGRRFLMRAEMRAVRLADVVVTVDSRLARHARALVPERSDHIYSLKNFVDTSVFAPPDDAAEEARLRSELRRAWNIPDSKIVLFCPRRMVKKNGVIYPSLALATMDPQDRDRFLLLHAGEGGEREEIERIVQGKGLQGYVRLLGEQGRAAILDLYRLSDVVLVPSVHSENVEEATSLAALEAMASGRPLVAGDVGGLAEIVMDGETGLLVPADEEALAAAILRLADEPGLRTRLAETARAYVTENHSHHHVAAAYAAIYENTAQAAAAGRTGAGWDAVVGGAPQDRPPVPVPIAPISVQGYLLHPVNLEQAAQWVIQNAEAYKVGQTVGTGDTSKAAEAARMRVAVSFNPELAICAQRDPAAAEALLEADFAYPDGIGAVWAAKRQGAVHVERVPGIDLAHRVLELAAERDLSTFFLGAEEGVAEEAARRQMERLPGLRIAGTHHGFFSREEEDEVVRKVAASGADILLVATGAPRQEIFLYRHRHELGTAVGLGVGGSFDIWAGVAKRAPLWVQQAKAEWLYRLASEPSRVRRQGALVKYTAQVVFGSADDYGPPRRGRARAAAFEEEDTGGGS